LSREKTKNLGRNINQGTFHQNQWNVPQERSKEIYRTFLWNVSSKFMERSNTHLKRPTRRLFEGGGYIRIPLQKQAVLEANFDCF